MIRHASFIRTRGNYDFKDSNYFPIDVFDHAFFQKRHHKITPSEEHQIGRDLFASNSQVPPLPTSPQIANFPPQIHQTTTGDDPLITEHFSSNEEAPQLSSGKRLFSNLIPTSSTSSTEPKIYRYKLRVILGLRVSCRLFLHIPILAVFFSRWSNHHPDLRYIDLILKLVEKNTSSKADFWKRAKVALGEFNTLAGWNRNQMFESNSRNIA